ncbi:MAG: hypothetical protein U9Q15_04015 [Patescibacteria group bacterium]|nr:hypothetical protein [Patescibacteria group bacterium]
MEFSADVFITPEIDSLASDAADAIKDFNTTLSGMDINQLNQWSNVESIRTKATNAITEISEFVSVLANISTTTGSIFSIYVRSFLVEPQAVLDTTQKYIDTFDAVNNASSINMRSALEEGDLMLDLSDYNKLSSSEKDLVAAYVYIQKLSAASGKFATRDNIKTALDTKVFQLMSENMTDALLSFNTAV